MGKTLLDIAGTYPNEGIALNISKYTTHRELIEIEGISDPARRRIGFNLAGGHVNAVEICESLYKAPSLDTVYLSYLKSKGLPVPASNLLYTTPLKSSGVILAHSPPELGEEPQELDPLDDDYDTQEAA